MSIIRLSHPTGQINGTITLDGSKSISNRVLIIKALCKKSFNIDRLSTSDDTRSLQELLSNGLERETYDVGHAGTTFRFLTAYLAMQQGSQILTGSARMLERPIGPLVDALRVIGCKITYLGKRNYPPLRLDAVPSSSLKNNVTIDATISSQYITALLLIAPTIPGGLTIKLSGELVSESYMQLTLSIIKDFGIEASFFDNTIKIEEQDYRPYDYTIEADWSASSYHYALVALASSGTLRLKGLFRNSLQGDAAITSIGNAFGVNSIWKEGAWVLSKSNKSTKLNYNFINQPDIAQTIGVICSAIGLENDFSGLKTLKIKETDRIFAMDQELNKVKSSFQLRSVDKNDEHYEVAPTISFDKTPRFDTYKDHRMAMSFAPLALLHPIEIANSEVVTKSYPGYWSDLESLGFVIEKK